MSAQEQVTKLEALLARVNGRRGAPRPVAATAAAYAEAAQVEPSHVEAAPEPRRAPAAPAPEPRTPPPARVEPVAAVAAPPPAAPVAAAPVHVAPSEPTVAVVATRPGSMAPGAEDEVEVEEGMAEVDLDDIEEDEAADASLSDSVADLDVLMAASAPEDVPASSRRPIQLQVPDDAFHTTATPLPPHPVPPESGRQVAAPVADFEGDLSGVRSVAAVDIAPAAELKAEVTRPVVAAASPAVFHGAAPAFQPATFGELLDATLAL
jgi:hypothetical protein